MNKMYVGIGLVGIGIGLSLFKKSNKPDKPDEEKEFVVDGLTDYTETPLVMFKRILKEMKINFHSCNKSFITKTGSVCYTTNVNWSYEGSEEEAMKKFITQLDLEFYDTLYINNVEKIKYIFSGCNVKRLEFTYYIEGDDEGDMW